MCGELRIAAAAVAVSIGLFGATPVLSADEGASQAPKPAEQSQPSPTAPAANPAGGSTVMTPATVFNKNEIQAILGKEIRSATGEDMGRIVNVIVDRGGQARAAVIDFGGFLGVGSRKIAVDWNALHFAPEEKSNRITLDLTRDQVKAAPEFKEGKPVVVLGAAGNTQTMPVDDLPVRQE